MEAGGSSARCAREARMCNVHSGLNTESGLRHKRPLVVAQTPSAWDHRCSMFLKRRRDGNSETPHVKVSLNYAAPQ
jgi:hypothetical protein